MLITYLANYISVTGHQQIYFGPCSRNKSVRLIEVRIMKVSLKFG